MTALLGYCLNVHPGESLAELTRLLAGPVSSVRALASPREPLPVGLWFPARVAAALAGDPAIAAGLRERLEGLELRPFTVNAFPAGDFHAREVKRAVYRPTWSDPARLRHTADACRALARLLPEGARGSVSTVPVSYKAFLEGEAGLAAAGEALGRLALLLATDPELAGRDLSLGLEPEPLATLETTAEAVAFLERHVLGGAGRQVLRDAGLSAARAEGLLRTRIGVCLDACHLACEFERADDAVARLNAAGLRVAKVQLSSALRLLDPARNAAGRRRLLAFAEPRWLHQALGRLPSGGLVRAEDLDGLLGPDASLRAAFAAAEEVRVHFHVPLGWAGDAELGTTRDDLLASLPALCQATDHLEVETYTFSALPAPERARWGDDVVPMVAAELAWARAALARAGPGA